MASNTTLYWDPLSLPCRAVKVLIDIGRIPCQYVPVNLYSGQTKKPQYLKRNPLGKIPFLVDGNYKLSQTDAILIYICETHKSIPISFYGQTPKQRAKVHQYLSWYQGYFRLKYYKIVRMVLGFFQTRKPVYQNQIDDFQAGLHEATEMLDKLLKGKDYITNQTLTIADLVFFFETASLLVLGLDMGKYEEVNRWFKGMEKIPEVKASLEEWLPLGQQIRGIYEQMKIIKSKL